jgi:transaldolase / glucose-6-phosphate isomerase
VLSYFGLVPAALMGVSVEGLLHRAQVAEQNCNSYESGSANSGLWMGLVAGELALQGRDKLTFVVSEPISSFGLWAEQLVAESLGKEGKGILPVADEPLGDPAEYGEDRVFVYLRDPDNADGELDAKIDALGRAGHPTVTLAAHGAADLGRIFFFSEFAVAVAGWVLGINAFNQPNVQEAKDNTNAVLAKGDLPQVDPGSLDELLSGASPPHYVAIMGYVQPSDEFEAAVTDLRLAIRERTKATTTFGYGPRFLHSTGQMHKGGPPTGLFLQLIHDGDRDVEIPDAGYTFGHLKNAQAVGDLQTLRDHGLPAVQVRLEGNPAEAVRRLI